MKNRIIMPLCVCTFSMLSGACGTLNKAGENGSDSKNGVRKEAVLPQDREKIVKPTASVYTQEELSRGVVKGDWAIETVYGKPAVGEKAPFLKFVPAEKKVYGNNGCNVINASYTYNPTDSTISFSDMLSTLKACAKEGITDTEIGAALDATSHYSWMLEGDEYHLSFYDNDRNVVMQLMHQNFQFLNGTWKVTEISGEAVDIPDMKLVIDVDEGKVHGNTGCNILNGSLETDMDTPNSISFQAIGITRMACPDQNHEMKLLVALEEAAKAKPMAAGKVALLNNEGKTVLVLERTSDS